MELIAQQLGALLVNAIPTALLFLLLVIAYQFLVQGPLTATLKQRRALTFSSCGFTPCSRSCLPLWRRPPC